MGPKGGPVAVCTVSGWTLQDPANFTTTTALEEPLVDCLFTKSANYPRPSPDAKLQQNVELLWKL